MNVTVFRIIGAVCILLLVSGLARGELPDLGAAPPIKLTSQDAKLFTLDDVRGKVAVVNFVFTRCGDRCPMLVSKLLKVRDALGAQYSRDVHFVTVTIDAEYDKPKVLRKWAAAFGADTEGWSFLTGNPAEVYEVIEQYGVFRMKRDDANIDHNLLTSIIDRNGTMRVQYIGDRFDAGEFVADIRSLID